MDFLWHKVDDKEKEEIRKQAKRIMDDFSKELSKVGELKESFIERGEGVRKEGDGSCLDLDRKEMFDNAPKKNSDFIIAEKKKW